MSLTARRTILGILSVLFAIVATALIFYSNGWRLDIETWSIDKLGGLYIAGTVPRDVSITIEKANFILNPGLLRSGTFIPNLFPKNYAVEAAKKGYRTWTKDFAVEPSKVTKTYPIVLMPNELPFVRLSDNTTDFSVGPSYIATTSTHGGLFIGGLPAAGSEVVSWSVDGTLAITRNKTGQFFLIDTQEGNSATNLSLLMQNTNGEKLATAIFHPTINSRLIVSTQKRAYEWLLNDFSLRRLSDNPAERIITIGRNVLWHHGTTTGTLINTNDTTALSIIKDRLISQPDAQFSLSPDGEKLAVTANFEPGKIRIYFLTANDAYKKQPADFVILNTGGSEAYPAFSWHESSAYVFIRSGGALKFVEIDNRQPMNFQTLSSAAEGSYYDERERQLYLLSGDSLYRADME